MLAIRRLLNQHGDFKHGHLLSYYTDANSPLKYGILSAIAHNECDENVFICEGFF